jgi:hypothetical protein
MSFKEEQLEYLRLRQDSKNFGMVGVGYVQKVLDEYEAKLAEKNKEIEVLKKHLDFFAYDKKLELSQKREAILGEALRHYADRMDSGGTARQALKEVEEIK